MDAEIHAHLRDAFEDAGWSVQHSLHARGERPDLVMERNGRRFVVEIKSARDARRPELRGLLADAFLRARHYAKALHGEPMAVVFAPAISERAARDLRDYVERFAAGSAFALVDGNGRFELHGPDLEGLHVPFTAPEKAPSKPKLDLFSDRNRWLLKVLLGRRLPAEWIQVGRERIVGTSGLARVANLPLPTVSRFIHLARERGFLEVDRKKSLRLVRVDALLDEWRNVSAKHPLQSGARWILSRPADATEHLSRALARAKSPHALALYAAARALGLGFVHGAVPHVYVASNSTDAWLDEVGLRRTEDGEQPDVFIREPLWPESIFRAAVSKQNVLVTDVVQCWLDVSHDPARGREQGEQILRRIKSALGDG